LFGGVSAEHEVSIITGIQVATKIDREKYEPLVVYATNDRLFQFYPGFTNKKDFFRINPKLVFFGRDAQGAFIQQQGYFAPRIYFDVAYLAFHGGEGESGPMQGFLQVLGVPFTSSACESSVITMNKSLTRKILTDAGLPVIIKPVHLGSSIGIKIAKTEIDLQKFLSEASFLDDEVVVEKLLTNFVEYNCSVRQYKGKLQASPIEKPIGRDEILSFADKYERGGKQSTGEGGMAELNRELPAKIAPDLAEYLQQTAMRAYRVCKCNGVVRIDFMHTQDGQTFITEINPIPGSMAFYLWEADGISFTEQISAAIEQALENFQARESKRLKYETNIVEKFINGKGGHKNTAT
jgi:D-alanine-D-alanine ligase